MKPYDAEAELTMLKALRRDFHANPELGFEEERTSAIVREKLLEAGIEVVGGLGKTGLVGTLKVGDGNRAHRCARIWMRSLCRRSPTGLTNPLFPARCMPVVMMGTPPCCLERHAGSPPNAIFPAPSISSSSRRKKGGAAHSPC
jgi:hypothetical protein